MANNRQFVELLLTCEDEQEAGKIAQSLLDQRLVNCAKTLPVNARYWWKQEIEEAKEILLVMESAADLFDEIEVQVRMLHSYDTFVLQAVPFVRISKDAAEWMKDNLKPQNGD